MTTRRFPLGDVLTAYTGYLVSPRGVGAIYDVLNFMTSGNLYTHQLPRAQRECGPAILAQHPQLAEVQVPEFRDEQHVLAWLAEQIDQFGGELALTPLAKREHTRIDPVAEMRMLRPDLPIVVLGGDSR